jgi:hypothetical protein
MPLSELVLVLVVETPLVPVVVVAPTPAVPAVVVVVVLLVSWARAVPSAQALMSPNVNNFFIVILSFRLVNG